MNTFETILAVVIIFGIIGGLRTIFKTYQEIEEIDLRTQKNMMDIEKKLEALSKEA